MKHAENNWVILLFHQERLARRMVGGSGDTNLPGATMSFWMEPVYAALRRGRPASGRLLGLSYLQHLAPLRVAVDSLDLDVVPDRGRRFGASVDGGGGAPQPDRVRAERGDEGALREVPLHPQ